MQLHTFFTANCHILMTNWFLFDLEIVLIDYRTIVKFVSFASDNNLQFAFACQPCIRMDVILCFVVNISVLVIVYYPAQFCALSPNFSQLSIGLIG